MKKSLIFCPWPSHMNTLRLNASLLLWRSISCFTSSSSSCRYMLHLRFSQEGCFVAYQHTPQFTKRVACAYNRIQNNTGRCTIWPSILHHFFHTHNRDFVHELHVWTVRWMSISLPFHTAVPFIRLCYVLDNSASR